MSGTSHLEGLELRGSRLRKNLEKNLD